MRFFAGKSSGGVSFRESARDKNATRACEIPEARSKNCVLLKGYPKKDLYVIGLAHGMKEAHEVVKQIIDEVYQATEGFDIITYLQAKKDSKNH